MTLALRSPDILSALIPVDNAPLDASLKSEFHQYIQGLQDIEEAALNKQFEADNILQKYKIVGSNVVKGVLAYLIVH